jgi:NADPH-dependent glutamate synthase beta subunit-like oxidoreductase
VAGVVCDVTRVDGEGSDARAVVTGAEETIGGGLVLRSIGYQSIPLAGAPFDARAHVIPNSGGVVDDGEGQGAEGSARLYCAGWVKRGPTGVILSTMNDAFETAESVCAVIIMHPLRRCGGMRALTHCHMPCLRLQRT